MTLSELLVKWSLRLAIIIGVLGVIALYGYRAVSAPTFKSIKISRSSKDAPLNITQANQTLGPSVLSSNNPASSTSQEGSSSTSQGSTGSLQSDLNVNDPSLSSSPLVQSLYSGGQ